MSTPVTDAAIREQAAAWLARRDRGFDPAEKAAFDQWCRSDPRHAEAGAALAAAWELFDGPRADGTNDLFRADFREIGWRRTRRRLTIGATSLAAASLAVLLWQQTPRPVVSRGGEATAQISQPERRILPDGSVVELRHGATIAVDYAGALRRVRLQAGEAHFQVVENRDRAFVVVVGEVEVRAVGTAFSVERGPTQVEVVVTQGRVAVEKALEDASRSPLPAPALSPPSATLATLDAGHRVTVDVGAQSAQVSRVISMSAAELTERVAWRLPRLEFTDTSLVEAAALFNRNNRVQLRISDEDLARLRVSGVFRSDNIDGFVGLLETSFGVRATRTTDAIVLRKVR